jgi:hypothetical protein
MTFDRLKLDLTEFPSGKQTDTHRCILLNPFNLTEEVYFALSRVTSLHGLQVIGFQLKKVGSFVFFNRCIL